MPRTKILTFFLLSSSLSSLSLWLSAFTLFFVGSFKFIFNTTNHAKNSFFGYIHAYIFTSIHWYFFTFSIDFERSIGYGVFLVHMFCCYAYNRCCCSCGFYSRKFFFRWAAFYSAEDFIPNDTWLHVKNKLYYKCPWPVFLHKNMQNNENFCALSFGFSAFSNEFWIFEHMSSFDIIAESNLFFRSFSGPICKIPHNFHLNHCGSRIEKRMWIL